MREVNVLELFGDKGVMEYPDDCCDVSHTMSPENVVADIDDFLENHPSGSSRGPPPTAQGPSAVMGRT